MDDTSDRENVHGGAMRAIDITGRRFGFLTAIEGYRALP